MKGVGVETSKIREWIELTHHADPKVRAKAAGALCPCHVRSNSYDAWARLLAMIRDPHPKVRRTVLHAIVDGSPKARTHEVAELLQALWNDPDLKTRKRTRAILDQYRRTGRLHTAGPKY